MSYSSESCIWRKTKNDGVHCYYLGTTKASTRMILVQMHNIFRLLIGVPDYSSSESYGEKQKLIGFIVIISLFHRGVSVNQIS